MNKSDNKETNKDSDSTPQVDLSGKLILPEILKEIPEEAANFYQFVPFGKNGDVLEVAMVDPDDFKAKEALRFIASQYKVRTKIYRILPENFQEAVKQYRNLKREVRSALVELEEQLKAEGLEKAASAEEFEKSIVEAPISKIVSNILRHAQEGRASDIHIEPVETEVRVRFRVDGVLYTSIKLPKKVHVSIIQRVKILSGMKIDETRVPQDGRFHVVIDKQKIDFRVSVLPTAHGEKAALRLLDPSVGLMGFEELGLAGRNLEMIKRGIKKPFGMVLLTGPTGSGKTTTLYAILNELNEEAINIISLEDPVEYFIAGLNQSQIRPEIDFTFASGLRSILRQDPDVIMVGEIRDEETASLAVQAALTGHIVLSTLHTNNAIGVIPRLVDMGIGVFLLPSVINLAIAQRLLRRLCNHCKKPVEPEGHIVQTIKNELAGISEETKKQYDLDDKLMIYQAEGCKYCAGKGTQGRVALYEILEMTPELEKIILTDLSEGKIAEEARRQGMVSMKQDGIIKALKGVVAFEEVMGIIEGSVGK